MRKNYNGYIDSVLSAISERLWLKSLIGALAFCAMVGILCASVIIIIYIGIWLNHAKYGYVGNWVLIFLAIWGYAYAVMRK